MLMGAFFMPSRDRELKRLPFDWTGYALIAGALVLVLTAIARGQRDGWLSDQILAMGFGGLALGIAFVWSQLKADFPILDCGVFRNPQFAAAACLGFVFGAGNFASTYIIPVFAQTVQNFTATWAGMVTVPAGLVVMCFFPIGGRLVDTFPTRYLAMTGLGLFAFGAALLHGTDVNTAFWVLAFYTIIGRLGQSIMLPAINVSALQALPAEQLNNASGSINFVRLMGGAFGVNLLVVFMEQRTEFHFMSMAATQTSQNQASRELLDEVSNLLHDGGVANAVLQPGALHYLGRVIEAQAQTMGFQDGFMIIAIVFVAALLPAAMLGRGRD